MEGDCWAIGTSWQMASDTGSPDVPGLGIITPALVTRGANGENEEKVQFRVPGWGADDSGGAPVRRWSARSLSPSVPPEPVDRGQVPLAQGRVGDPEPLRG